MLKNARDNLSKFFYDSGKVSFAVLVIGGFTHLPLSFPNLMTGSGITLTLLILGFMLDYVPAEENR